MVFMLELCCCPEIIEELKARGHFSSIARRAKQHSYTKLKLTYLLAIERKVKKKKIIVTQHHSSLFVCVCVSSHPAI